MIVVTTALRTALRSRRATSLASLVRVLGSVRVSDSPPGHEPVSRDRLGLGA